MYRYGLPLCLFVVAPLALADSVWDQQFEALAKISDVETLLTEAVEFRDRYPGYVTTEQLKDCVAQARPIRKKGKALLRDIREATLPARVKSELIPTINNTFACLWCNRNGIACRAAQEHLRKAKTAVGKIGGNAHSREPISK